MPATSPKIELAARRATDRFCGETERTFERKTETVLLNGTGTRTLLLPNAPVATIDAIVVAGATYAPYQVGTPAPAGSYAYQVDLKAGILRSLGGLWPEGLGNVAVTYTHGFGGIDDVPGDIQDAVLEHAATIAMVLAHVQQESGGSTSATYGQTALVGTTAKWVQAVEKYRLQAASR
jgi:hypothetical protein